MNYLKHFTRRLREVMYVAYGHYPTRIGGIPFKGDPVNYRFWRTTPKNEWEPYTLAILQKFLKPDSIYCDIGAWIGPTVLYASKLCKQVYCFEPDYNAYRYLLWNIELNKLDNVLPFNMALSDRNGVFRMAPFGKSLGDTTSSLLNAGKPGSISVAAITLKTAQDIALPKQIDFLKIDIEGAEFALLPAIKEYLTAVRPIVYLSTHTPYLKATERPMRMRLLLEALDGYDICLDEVMNPIEPESLMEGEAINQFKSTLFLSKEQYQKHFKTSGNILG